METTNASRAGMSPSLVASVIAVLIAIAALVLGALGGGDDGDDEDEEGTSEAAALVAALDADAHYAVTLTNGTVYFGKLSNEGAVLLLDDVYYLAGATAENPSGSLVKRGAEIAAPEGPMVLNLDLIVQIDRIGDDSVIARGIERIASGEGGETTTTVEETPTTTTTGG